MALDDGTFAKHGSVNLKTPKGPGAGPSNIAPSRIPAALTVHQNSGGGGGGSAGVGSNSLGQVSTKPAPVPSANAFLSGDSTYQGQLSDYAKALADYQAQQNTQKTQYQGQYATNLKSLSDARKGAEGDITDDYASRGLANSGLFSKAYSDLESQYDQRQTDLNTQDQSFLQSLTDALNNLKTTQQAGITKAKQDALGRRTASLTS